MSKLCDDSERNSNTAPAHLISEGESRVDSDWLSSALSDVATAAEVIGRPWSILAESETKRHKSGTRPATNRGCRIPLRGRPVQERLAAMVDRSAGPDACHPFQGRLDTQGYGHMESGGKSYTASRLTLELKLGRSLEAGEMALHSCANPPCCNPQHLRPGTHAENMAERLAQGRAPRGANIRTAKLTEEQAREVLELSRQGIPNTRIGQAYGISDRLVGYIATGKRWGHLQSGEPIKLPEGFRGVTERLEGGDYRTTMAAEGLSVVAVSARRGDAFRRAMNLLEQRLRAQREPSNVPGELGGAK